MGKHFFLLFAKFANPHGSRTSQLMCATASSALFVLETLFLMMSSFDRLFLHTPNIGMAYWCKGDR